MPTSGVRAACGDEGSYTQPAAELLMPFDVSEGRVSFLQASNIGDVDVSTHWIFWSEDCNELVDFSICLTQNDTVVVDPQNMGALDAANVQIGPRIDLSGSTGIVTVTAYETDGECRGFRSTGATLRDGAIVGSFTVADTEAQYAFGNDALGLGTDQPANPTRVVLPAATDRYDLQILNPASLDVSLVFLATLERTAIGAVRPARTDRRFSTTFYDNMEVPTSLPDTTIGCVLTSSIRPGLIPDRVELNSSGLLRLSPVGGVEPDRYVWGIKGEAIGEFGVSSSLRSHCQPAGG